MVAAVVVAAAGRPKRGAGAAPEEAPKSGADAGVETVGGATVSALVGPKRDANAAVGEVGVAACPKGAGATAVVGCWPKMEPPGVALLVGTAPKTLGGLAVALRDVKSGAMAPVELDAGAADAPAAIPDREKVKGAEVVGAAGAGAVVVATELVAGAGTAPGPPPERLKVNGAEVVVTVGAVVVGACVLGKLNEKEAGEAGAAEVANPKVDLGVEAVVAAGGAEVLATCAGAGAATGVLAAGVVLAGVETTVGAVGVAVERAAAIEREPKKLPDLCKVDPAASKEGADADAVREDVGLAAEETAAAAGTTGGNLGVAAYQRNFSSTIRKDEAGSGTQLTGIVGGGIGGAKGDGVNVDDDDGVVAGEADETGAKAAEPDGRPLDPNMGGVAPDDPAELKAEVKKDFPPKRDDPPFPSVRPDSAPDLAGVVEAAGTGLTPRGVAVGGV